jgi:hypothetical protein
MIESFVGVAVPATRQNCGSPVFVVHPVLPVVQPGGVLKVPPVIVCAAVISPCGRDRFTRPSHVVAADTAVAAKKTPRSDAVAITTGFKYGLIRSSPQFHLLRLPSSTMPVFCARWSQLASAYLRRIVERPR